MEKISSLFQKVYSTVIYIGFFYLLVEKLLDHLDDFYFHKFANASKTMNGHYLTCL